MKTWMHLVLIATLALVFGFSGAYATVAWQKEDLAGPIGPTGPVGPEGPEGPKGSDATTRPAVIHNLQRQLISFRGRMADVEEHLGYAFDARDSDVASRLARLEAELLSPGGDPTVEARLTELESDLSDLCFQLTINTTLILTC